MTQRSRGLGFRMRTSGILIEASSQDDVAVRMEPRPGIRCRYCHFKCVKPQAGPGLGPHLKLLLPQIFLATGDAAVLVVVVAILWILVLEPLLLWELVLSVDLSVAALARILILLMLSAMQPGNFNPYIRSRTILAVYVQAFQESRQPSLKQATATACAGHVGVLARSDCSGQALCPGCASQVLSTMHEAVRLLPIETSSKT